MKSLMWLVDCMLADASMLCSTSTTKDAEYLHSRVEHEGLSFLTITLPQFWDGVQTGLVTGRVCSRDFPAFKSHRSRSLPAFMQGLTSLVFDINTGDLLNEPSHEALEAIRQICLSFKKLLAPCTKDRVRGAFEQFKRTEFELRTCLPDRDCDRYRHFVDTGRYVWQWVLRGFNPFDLTPRHGPGATAERISGNRKYNLKSWHERLEPYFPIAEYGVPVWYPSSAEEESIEDSPLRSNIGQNFMFDNLKLQAPVFVSPRNEMPVRVITVPKTLKTPRIIAIEPVCMQYTQQAILSFLVKRLEGSALLRGSIGFTDQAPNQQMAYRGSLDGNLATIDLSEASDRVHSRLVADMLSTCPELRAAIFACRSTRAQLPDGSVIPLKKFASMGSALCFPIEAMVFLTIITSTLLRKKGLRISHSNVHTVLDNVRVYGDDIICPTEDVDDVVDALIHFGMKVNTAKSFWNGKFRESCGRDYFDGTDITPVYIRRQPPTTRSDSVEVLSFVSTANQFYRKGWWITAHALRTNVEKAVGTSVPHVADTSEIIGWTSFLGYRTIGRWCDLLHRYEVKGLVPSVRKDRDSLNGYSAMMKIFLEPSPNSAGSALSVQTEKDLLRSVRRGSVQLKSRWAVPY